MSTDVHQITASELLMMPDDGFRYELLKGELKKMSPAGQRHGRVVMNISTPLDQYVRQNNLGVVFAAETGFKISADPDTVLAPDVAFVGKENEERIGNREGYWPGAPDLAVEVISPGDTYTEVEEKVLEWLSAGSRMVVVVDPRKEIITIYRSLTDIRFLTRSDKLEGGNVISGWSLPIADIFA